MEYKSLRIIICAALCLVMLAALYPVSAGAGASIFVNDPQSLLPVGLENAYVAGSGGSVSRLGIKQAYALTGRGLESVGQADAGIPPSLPVSGEIAIAYSKIRVGLYYYDETSSIRNPTLDYANLENAVGSGYRFGYYDSDRVFHEVGETAETAITMSKDLNLDTSGGHIGCYHILLPDTYRSFSAAKEAAESYSGGFPAYYNGTYRALVGNYDSAQAAANDASARGIPGTAFSASSSCVVVSRSSDAAILFEFDCGTQNSLAVSPKSENGRALTWFKGYKYYGDFEYVRRTGNKLTVINVVDIEDYVKGSVVYEMNPAWPLEALKAQAVCARTYAANSIGRNSSYGFDVTNDTFSQVYRGANLATANSDAAVDATAGVYLTYEGKPVTAMYSSSFGGGSENSENVMTSAVGYLRGVNDPYEAASDSINSRSSWRFTYTKAELASYVNKNGYSIGSVEDIELTYSDTGNVIGIKLTDANGRSAEFSKTACYNFCCGSLGLYSIRFGVTSSGGGFAFEGSGWGHSLGMSQYGAYAMADTYGFTYDRILGFYYTGVALMRGRY